MGRFWEKMQWKRLPEASPYGQSLTEKLRGGNKDFFFPLYPPEGGFLVAVLVTTASGNAGIFPSRFSTEAPVPFYRTT